MKEVNSNLKLIMRRIYEFGEYKDNGIRICDRNRFTRQHQIAY